MLANIFLGKIKNWDDPAIKKLNKGKNIPGTAITVIHRSDGSGTTYNLTDYLSHVSKEWKSRVGRGTAVDWPTGVGGRGSSGVSAALSQTNGGITYVDVAFSLANHFKFAAIQNRAGKYTLEDDRARRTRQWRHLDRESVEVGAARLPDLHVHVRDHPEADWQGGRAQEVRPLGSHERAIRRTEAPLPADP